MNGSGRSWRGRCRQVPRLPRKQPRRPQRQTGTKRTTMQSQPSAISARPCHAKCRHTPPLPHKVTIHVAKRRACHAKWRSMSPSARPATQTAAAPTAPNGNQARHQSHQSQPSAISATPAMQSDDPCRLPRKVTVDVAKCHACHANSRGDHDVNWEPSAPPEPVQCQKCHACHPKCTVDVAKCHACYTEVVLE